MSDDSISLVVAFPKSKADRATLRALVPGAPPFPALYANGVEVPCARCAMVLDVGPRVAALKLPVHCPACAVAVAEELELPLGVVDLGNPTSKPDECVCRNTVCGHVASMHRGPQGMCLVDGCRCGPGGWT